VIEVAVDAGGFPVSVELLERAATAALRRRDVQDAELSVALLGDDAIRTMNRDHLGHDRPTDVLSFALWDPPEPVVGDVYVGYHQAGRQARDLGVRLDEELVRLVVHGTLHVTGLDHPEEGAQRAASPMYRLQEELVRELVSGAPEEG
jgi:probable rRNA maturation factor